MTKLDDILVTYRGGIWEVADQSVNHGMGSKDRKKWFDRLDADYKQQFKDLILDVLNEALRTEPKTQSDLYRTMRQKVIDL